MSGPITRADDQPALAMIDDLTGREVLALSGRNLDIFDPTSVKRVGAGIEIPGNL